MTYMPRCILNWLIALALHKAQIWNPIGCSTYPFDTASMTVDISCEGEADCLGPETGRLARSVPAGRTLGHGVDQLRHP